MKKKTDRTEIKRRSALVLKNQPVDLGTILGNGSDRMVVTGHGYYDMDLNRSDEPTSGRKLMYEGNLVSLNQARRCIELCRNKRGETMEMTMVASSVRAVMVGKVK